MRDTSGRTRVAVAWGCVYAACGLCPAFWSQALWRIDGNRWQHEFQNPLAAPQNAGRDWLYPEERLSRNSATSRICPNGKRVGACGYYGGDQALRPATSFR